jgi:hypothetical protein
MAMHNDHVTEQPPHAVSRRQLLGTSISAAGVIIALSACGQPTAPGEPARRNGSGHQLYDNFWAHPNTTLIDYVMPSGQTWVPFYRPTGSQPQIVSGAYVQEYTEAAASASYLFADIGGDVGYMEAQFEFGSEGSTNGGALGLIIWQSTHVTQSPCHLACTEDSYIYSVINADGFVTLQTVNYAEAISLQYVNVTLNKTTGTATVTGADGNVTEITNSSIASISGSYPGPEIYYGHSNTDYRVSVYEFAADTVGYTR